MGGSRENTKRDGENDSEVQPEDDKRSGVGRVGVTLEGRSDLLKLKYYGKIVRMGEDRLVNKCM